MIVGTLTVRYRDHRLADDTIKMVPQEVYRAMTVDLEMGDVSAIHAFDIPTTRGRRVAIVKANILSVSFISTGRAKDIPMPRWVSIR